MKAAYDMGKENGFDRKGYVWNGNEGRWMTPDEVARKLTQRVPSGGRKDD